MKIKILNTIERFSTLKKNLSTKKQKIYFCFDFISSARAETKTKKWRCNMETLFLIGRIIFGLYFVFNGFNHFSNLSMMTGYAQSKGVPAPKLAVIFTGLLLLLGGLSVLTGYQTDAGLILLLIFFIPVTFMMHNFWKVEDQQMKMLEMVNFLKNLALVGSILMLFSIPKPWPFSL